MRHHIKKLLEQIERENNITILYACESGSRAWGFPSPNSDYDVRFIYRHPQSWYLQLLEKKDHIEIMAEHDIDATGWDIRKFLRLLHKSNSSVFEWLYSPIVYRLDEVFLQKIQNLSHAYFLPKSVLFHFLGIATGMLQKEFRGDTVKIKKYFYVLRPVLSAMWIVKYQTPPPVNFRDLLPLVAEHQLITAAIEKLLLQKETAKEGERIPKILILDSFVAAQMQNCETVAKTWPKLRNEEELLNEFYQKVILEI